MISNIRTPNRDEQHWKKCTFFVVGVRWAWANAVIHKLTRKASKQTSRERKNEKKNRRRRRFKLKLLGWMETVR